MAADTSYLWKRGNTYSAVLDIPKKLQPVLGERRFVKALDTDSLAEANKRKLPVLLQWRQALDTAREAATDPLAAARALAMVNRTTLGDDNPHYANAARMAIMEEALAIAEKHGNEAGIRFRDASLGKATFIKDTYKLWLGEVEGTEQTKCQHEAAVERYIEWAKDGVTVEETDRKKTGEYVSKLIASSGLTKRTIQRHCSSLANLWRWYKARGYFEWTDNPWLGHGLAAKKGKGKPYRRAYEDDLIVSLLSIDYGKRYKQDIPDLVRLALMTGARLEVFCAMKKDAIKKHEGVYWATIEDDKTEAGVRTVPLHSALNGLIERRLKGQGEYLIAGLEPGGPDKKRSWYVGKMFRYHKSKAGAKEKGQDYHAFRNTFIAVMEGLEVAESTVKLLVGHKRQSMTYGHYSKGERVKLVKAIETLDYGPKIMKLISQTA
ncbi:tyrosine-type recombinase/integrase [Bradyrhizobium sp. KB893862 SZCCT0404]|uniref:DUF6538 domain-containing protein n=1 Tax=Bradyrhizobium sp. KB893862 SZCCT0404 TaxID=2807672 RepID=UPI001BA79ACF|nr:DUF6538 domain-containing protein [Bradyrhizobium sp. KB893862 SZCCT0404]MBR1173872.1 tyrosine-type recombinase/integrase [Bradyrhizobium sp. KB893862 SZCCT0404]